VAGESSPATRRHIITVTQEAASYGQMSLSAEHAACEHGRLRRPGRFFAVVAHGAFPAEMHHAQKLQ